VHLSFYVDKEIHTNLQFSIVQRLTIKLEIYSVVVQDLLNICCIISAYVFYSYQLSTKCYLRLP